MPHFSIKDHGPAALTPMAILLVCIGLTACGSSSTGSSTASSPAASAPATAKQTPAAPSGATHSVVSDPARRRAAMRVARCMRRSGVNVPEPGPSGYITIGGAVASTARFHAALASCHNLIVEALGQTSLGK